MLVQNSLRFGVYTNIFRSGITEESSELDLLCEEVNALFEIEEEKKKTKDKTKESTSGNTMRAKALKSMKEKRKYVTNSIFNLNTCIDIYKLIVLQSKLKCKRDIPVF